jgi:hypothetical protein
LVERLLSTSPLFFRKMQVCGTPLLALLFQCRDLSVMGPFRDPFRLPFPIIVSPTAISIATAILRLSGPMPLSTQSITGAWPSKTWRCTIASLARSTLGLICLIPLTAATTIAIIVLAGVNGTGLSW